MFFFFNDTATTEIYTLSLHDALPISLPRAMAARDSDIGLSADVPSRWLWVRWGVSHMNASIPPTQRSLTAWLGIVFWLSVFLSPTVYFLMVLLAAKFQINLPQTFTLSLFFLIPV